MFTKCSDLNLSFYIIGRMNKQLRFKSEDFFFKKIMYLIRNKNWSPEFKRLYVDN